jgi:hypothetical protein
MRKRDASALLPPLSETRHSRESLLEALREHADLPAVEIAVATLYLKEIEFDILATLERACAAELDLPSERLLFRGLHILGGRRFPSGFQRLIAFLRGAGWRVDDLLGDAVTQTLARILAGMFDGDSEALCALIADADVDPFVRNAAMGTLAFLVFDKRVSNVVAREFLARYDAERLAPADDAIAWHAWMSAVALLGLGDFSQRVHAAFEDGRISPEFADESHFEKLLADAIERPDDVTRFEDENLGYIEDVLVSLEGFVHGDDADDDGSAEQDLSAGWLPAGDRIPAHNPWRHVGRNDPCPCGSGKKFKKCCLSTTP